MKRASNDLLEELKRLALVKDFSRRSSRTVTREYVREKSYVGHFEQIDDLKGHLFLIGNEYLGISREAKLRHPCCVIFEITRKVGVSKGTDPRHIKPSYRDFYVIVKPDAQNGLKKPTAFDPFLREIPTKAIFGEDYMGSLSDKDLQRLLEAVKRHAGKS
ncbi:MAG: hypothetical protein WHX93_02135 [bacterium]